MNIERNEVNKNRRMNICNVSGQHLDNNNDKFLAIYFLPICREFGEYY